MPSVLLVNPNYQQHISAVAQTTVGPPLGLGYLAASLEEQGNRVEILDANAESLSLKSTVERIREARPDLVGLTAVTPTIELCHEIARGVKASLPGKKCVVGGSHPSALPRRTLAAFPSFDCLVKGEGERTLVEIVERLQDWDALEEVQGLCFRRSNGQIVEKEGRPPATDLDGLPPPARHLLPNHLYRNPESDRFTGVIAMRGCPGTCGYCSVHNVFGRGIRQRTPEKVAEEVAECHQRFGARFLSFMDDTFSWDREWVLSLCREMEKRSIPNHLKWICLTRVDTVDRDLLGIMKRAGCHRVEFGIESGSQRILDCMNKRIRVEQIREAFRAARDIGLSTFGFVMLNFPGEDRTSLRETRRLVLDVDPDFIQVSFATPYPGTRLYDDCREQGLLRTERWAEYVFLRNPVIRNPNLTPEEIQGESRRLQRAFYLRPSYIVKTFLRTVRSGGSLSGLFSAGVNTLGKILSGSRPKPDGES